MPKGSGKPSFRGHTGKQTRARGRGSAGGKMTKRLTSPKGYKKGKGGY